MEKAAQKSIKKSVEKSGGKIGGKISEKIDGILVEKIDGNQSAVIRNQNKSHCQ